MIRKMDETVHDSLVSAAGVVREREEVLEDGRAERDAAIWRAYQDGYSLAEIAVVTELAKSTVALIVKLETARRSPSR